MVKKDAIKGRILAFLDGDGENSITVDGEGSVSYHTDAGDTLCGLRIFGTTPTSHDPRYGGVTSGDGKLKIRIHGPMYLDGHSFCDILSEKYPELIVEEGDDYFIYKGTFPESRTVADDTVIKMPNSSVTLKMEAEAEEAGEILPGICLWRFPALTYTPKGTATAPGRTTVSLKTSFSVDGIVHNPTVSGQDIKIYKDSFMLYAATNEPDDYWCEEYVFDIGEPIMSASSYYSTASDELDPVRGKLIRRLGRMELDENTEIGTLYINYMHVYTLKLPNKASEPWAYSMKLTCKEWGDFFENPSSSICMAPSLDTLYIHVDSDRLENISIAEYLAGDLILYPLEKKIETDIAKIEGVANYGDIIIDVCSLTDAYIEASYKE